MTKQTTIVVIGSLRVKNVYIFVSIVLYQQLFPSNLRTSLFTNDIISLNDVIQTCVQEVRNGLQKWLMISDCQQGSLKKCNKVHFFLLFISCKFVILHFFARSTCEIAKYD